MTTILLPFHTRRSLSIESLGLFAQSHTVSGTVKTESQALWACVQHISYNHRLNVPCLQVFLPSHNRQHLSQGCGWLSYWNQSHSKVIAINMLIPHLVTLAFSHWYYKTGYTEGDHRKHTTADGRSGAGFKREQNTLFSCASHSSFAKVRWNVDELGPFPNSKPNILHPYQWYQIFC